MIKAKDVNLKKFLGDNFRHFLKSEAFLEALPGHLPPDPVSQERMPKIIARMEKMVNISNIGD